jgi:hypothetical protein
MIVKLLFLLVLLGYFHFLCFSNYAIQSPNIRYFFLFSILTLAIAKRMKNVYVFGVLVAFTCLVHWRIFYGPFYLTCIGKSPLSVDIVVSSFEGSPRTAFITNWLQDMFDDIPFELYMNQTLSPAFLTAENCPVLQTKPKFIPAHIMKTHYLLLSMVDRSQDWILVLEDDATPIWPASFKHSLYCATQYNEYDAILLDGKNTMADILPHSGTGTAGVLYNANSLAKIIDVIEFKQNITCYPPLRDIATVIRDEPRLNVFTSLMITEAGFKSTQGSSGSNFKSSVFVDLLSLWTGVAILVNI